MDIPIGDVRQLNAGFWEWPYHKGHPQPLHPLILALFCISYYNASLSSELPGRQ